MLQLAEHILDTKAASFAPVDFKDRYEAAVLEMLKAKQSGTRRVAAAARPAGPNIVNLMEALKRSLAGAPTPKEALKSQRSNKGRKKVHDGQREMLLPIAGKGPPKTAKSAKAPSRKLG